MRICQLKPNKYTEIETFINNHTQLFSPSFIIVNGYFPTEIESTNNNIFTFPLNKFPVRGLLKKISVKTYEKLYCRALSRFFIDNNIDLAFAEYGPTGANIIKACKISGVPLITMFHGFDAFEKSILKNYQDKYLELFNDAAAIITVSKDMQKQIIGLGAPAKKVYYNPYGVDTKKFTPVINIRHNNTVNFLFVGRLTPKKAPKATINAFHRVYSKHRDVKLTIVGDGELMQECQQLVSKLHLEKVVDFKGSLPPEKIAEVMQEADIYVQHSVHASSGDAEGTPNSILEACASGLPVVSTRHGGIKDVVIHNETGYLVAEHDEAGMAAYMLSLAENEILRKEMGSKARNFMVNNFSIAQSNNKLLDIINCKS